MNVQYNGGGAGTGTWDREVQRQEEQQQQQEEQEEESECGTALGEGAGSDAGENRSTWRKEEVTRLRTDRFWGGKQQQQRRRRWSEFAAGGRPTDTDMGCFDERRSSQEYSPDVLHHNRLLRHGQTQTSKRRQFQEVVII
ncbi:hypothetical protein CRUP_012628 [Coryphaenoides rupestris]|nr:hypothetical protein CRUP_012628 [Coryphaenoides rupestris]